MNQQNIELLAARMSDLAMGACKIDSIQERAVMAEALRLSALDMLQKAERERILNEKKD